MNDLDKRIRRTNKLLSTGITPSPDSNAGFSHYRTTNLTATGAVIKSSAGNIYGFNINNLTSTIKYIKFVDAISVTAGSSTVLATIKVPGNTSIYVEGGCVQYSFTTGISVFAVTGSGDSSTATPTANSLMVDFKYR